VTSVEYYRAQARTFLLMALANRDPDVASQLAAKAATFTALADAAVTKAAEFGTIDEKAENGPSGPEAPQERPQ
jgi:hypothetical protein